MKISNLELVTTEGEIITEEWADMIFVDRSTIQLTINQTDLPKEYDQDDIESISYKVVQ